MDRVAGAVRVRLRDGKIVRAQLPRGARDLIDGGAHVDLRPRADGKRYSVEPPPRVERSAAVHRVAKLRRSGNLAAAERAARSALRRKASAHLYLELAAVLEAREDDGGALAVLSEGRASFPRDFELCMRAGWIALAMANLAAAEDAFRTGCAADADLRERATCHDGLALVLDQRGDELGAGEERRVANHLRHPDQLLKFIGEPNSWPPFVHCVWDLAQSLGTTIPISKLIDHWDFTIDLDAENPVRHHGLGPALFLRCFSNGQAELADLLGLEGVVRDRIDGRLDSKVVLAAVASLRPDIEHALRAHARRPGACVVVPIVLSPEPAGEGADREAFLNAETRVFPEAIDNWLGSRDPFAVIKPVRGASFFGRKDLLREVRGRIESGNHLGLFGLRKTGKTSFLWRMRDTLTPHLVVYVDAQRCPERSLACLVWAIARELGEQIRRRDLGVPPNRLRIARPDLEWLHVRRKARSALSLLNHDLASVREALRDEARGGTPRIVLALDEVERLLPAGGLGGFADHEEFFAYLRGSAQQEDLVVSVVCGANALVVDRPDLGGRDNPVFGFWERIFLPMFRKEECDEMTMALGRAAGATFDPAALDAIFGATGGHPYLIRLLCSDVIRDRPRPLDVREAQIHEGLDGFALRHSPAFHEIVSRFARDFPADHRILLRIARSENGLPSSVSAGGDGLRYLLDYGIVAQDGDRFRVTIDLLQRWLTSQLPSE